MEISISSNFVFILKEIFTNMFNQNGNLEILLLFLSLEETSLCNLVLISSFILKQTSLFIWYKVSKIILFFLRQHLKNSGVFLSLEDNKEHI